MQSPDGGSRLPTSTTSVGRSMMQTIINDIYSLLSYSVHIHLLEWYIVSLRHIQHPRHNIIHQPFNRVLHSESCEIHSTALSLYIYHSYTHFSLFGIGLNCAPFMCALNTGNAVCTDDASIPPTALSFSSNC